MLQRSALSGPIMSAAAMTAVIRTRMKLLKIQSATSAPARPAMNAPNMPPGILPGTSSYRGHLLRGL